MLHPSWFLGTASCTSLEQSSSAVRQTVLFRLHDVEKGGMSFL